MPTGKTTKQAVRAADRFVVDASALVKALAAEEAHTDAFTAWLDESRDQNRDLLAPHLLRYELGNVLAREAKVNPALGPALRQELQQKALLGFRFADGQRSTQFAPPLTFYDAAYLALAADVGATLVTYDEVLAEAAGRAGIPVLAPGR